MNENNFEATNKIDNGQKNCVLTRIDNKDYIVNVPNSNNNGNDYTINLNQNLRNSTTINANGNNNSQQRNSSSNTRSRQNQNTNQRQSKINNFIIFFYFIRFINPKPKKLLY